MRDGPVRLVALNQASLAFAVGRSEHDCDHVELWNTATRGLWRFGKPGACTNLGSTGAGISASASAAIASSGCATTAATSATGSS